MTPINKNLVGIWKKINMQIDYFENQNISVKIIDTNNNDRWGFLDSILRKFPFTGLHKWHIDEKMINEVEFIYIRYQNSDFQFIKMLKNIKNSNPDIKIIIEIPTYPYDNEVKLSLKNLTILSKDRWNRRKLHKFVDKILTFSNDEMIFNIPTLKLSNAVNTNIITMKKVATATENINVIAVANYVFWHGYDRFLEGMYKYYKSNNPSVKINLYLVGEGDELKRYKTLVDQYNLNDYVEFCGRKEGIELDEIYDKCEIGLDAMGRHRSKVYYNSSLKGKEYGAKGLPIISGVETELDADPTYKYYMRVTADDSPIDMIEVLEFYNQVYDSGESKEKISLNINNYTKKILMSQLHGRKL